MVVVIGEEDVEGGAVMVVLPLLVEVGAPLPASTVVVEDNTVPLPADAVPAVKAEVETAAVVVELTSVVVVERGKVVLVVTTSVVVVKLVLVEVSEAVLVVVAVSVVVCERTTATSNMTNNAVRIFT